MKVSVQYAESLLTETLPPATEADNGTVHPSATTPKKRGLFGAGKGEIWMADDWDSKETNEEIARLFNDGPVSPDEP
jgi:hypothetical protein